MKYFHHILSLFLSTAILFAASPIVIAQTAEEHASHHPQDSAAAITPNAKGLGRWKAGWYGWQCRRWHGCGNGRDDEEHG